jgi:hypothetical protein
VQNISLSLGKLLGTVVCSCTESADHTGKNEKVVIPMHPEEKKVHKLLIDLCIEEARTPKPANCRFSNS